MGWGGGHRGTSRRVECKWGAGCAALWQGMAVKNAGAPTLKPWEPPGARKAGHRGHAGGEQGALLLHYGILHIAAGWVGDGWVAGG